MLNKNATIFKNIGLGIVLLLGIISCEKDFEDIGIDLVDNKAFKVGDTGINVIAYNRRIATSRVDNNNPGKQPLSLLGVNQDKDFGYLKSALISQLRLPVANANKPAVDFGDNAIVDLVVVDIPYLLKDTVIIKEITQDNDTIYERVKSLDSIYGNRNVEFNISVNELGTFLNVLDPDNPSQGNKYYSDKEYMRKDLLASEYFKPNVYDTVLYVERRYLDGDPNTVDDIDTIMAEDISPSIKLFLNNDFFKNRFLEHDNPADFESNSSFVQYFRGLYIDANGVDGALMNLSTRDAKMTIYYTNDEIKDEAEGEDLNGNGVTGEEGVLVRSKQDMDFIFSGVTTGKYIRDYNRPDIVDAIENPDMEDGESKLYIQGVAGTEAVIKLFTQEQLDLLRQKEWLINEANLTVYLDGAQNEVPSKLFLYNYEHNSLIIDYYTFNFGPDVFGGELEYDKNGKPEKYKFRITKYITEILDINNPRTPSELALKNFVRTDVPEDLINLDTIIGNYNWIPKGVILKGNLPETDKNRIKLEIFYSK